MFQEIIIDQIEQNIKLYKIIEINEKTFALCFRYIYIHIYKIDESKKYSKILEKDILTSKKYGRINVIKVNESELASYSYYCRHMEFLDIKNKLKLLQK